VIKQEQTGATEFFLCLLRVLLLKVSGFWQRRIFIQFQPQIIIEDSARQSAGGGMVSVSTLVPAFINDASNGRLCSIQEPPMPSRLMAPGCLQVYILERNQVAGAFRHARGDNAVVERMGIFSFRNGGTAAWREASRETAKSTRRRPVSENS